MTALPSTMQLEQTQPFCLFGIKYPQVSWLCLCLRALLSLMQNHENHHIMRQFFFCTGSYLCIFYLSLTVSLCIA